MSATAAGPSAPTPEQRARVDFDAVLAGIERAQEETRKFVQEGHKLATEREKLAAEARKLERDRSLAPWQVVAASATATAAVIGASAGVAALLLRWWGAGGA